MSDRLTAEELAELRRHLARPMSARVLPDSTIVYDPALNRLIAAAERAERYERALIHIANTSTDMDSKGTAASALLGMEAP